MANFARFAAIRVRVADGPTVRGGKHLPGDEAWLIGTWRGCPRSGSTFADGLESKRRDAAVGGEDDRSPGYEEAGG